MYAVPVFQIRLRRSESMLFCYPLLEVLIPATLFLGSNVFVFNDLAEVQISESLIVIKESIFQGNNLT